MTNPAITVELDGNHNLTPHHEGFCESVLGIFSSDDGKWIFESIFAALKNKTVAHAA